LLATFDRVLRASPWADQSSAVRVIGSDACLVAALRAAGWRVRGEGHADAVVLLTGDPSRVRAERAQSKAVLMVVADVDVDGRLAALAAGADDVLHPAAAKHELAARLNVQRARRRRPEVLAAGDLRIDLGQRIAIRGQRPLDLGRRELDLLTFLVHNRGLVVSRGAIADHVWGDGRLPASDSAVAVLVLRLRRKLEAGGESRMIQTVRGWGYVLRV
jgi:DNA-binding response OmpR family regulator